MSSSSISSSSRRDKPGGRGRWISTANKFKVAEAFQSVGRRRMFRQVISRAKNIVAVRIFDSDVCGIAVLHEDGQIILIDKGSGKIQYDTFIEAVETSIIKSAAFAHHANMIAVYTTKKRLLIFDHGAEFNGFDAKLSINVVPLMEGKKCTLRVIVWSRDDALVAAGGEDRVARVYDVRTGVLVHRIANFHHDIIVGMDFHPTGRFLVTGSKDKHARVFDLSRSDPSLELEHNAEGRCYAVVFSPDGSRLAVGADNNKTVLIDLKLQRVKQTLEGHKDYVRAVMFTPDGRRILTGGKDGQLYFYDVATGQPLLPIRRIGWTVMMAQSTDGYQFVTAAQDKSSGPVLHLNIFNIFHDRSSDMLMTMKLTSPVTALCFSKDGEKMFSGGKNGVVSMHDITTFQEEAVLRLHTKPVSSIATAPSGHVASASEDGSLVVFDSANPNDEVATVHVSKTPLTCTALSACGRWLACANVAGCLFIFDETNNLVCHHQVCDAPVSAIDFGFLERHGADAASANDSSDRPAGNDDDDAGDASAGMRNGSVLIAVACHNKSTVVLDVADAVNEYLNDGIVEEAVRFVVTGHDKEVYSVRFSADSSYLATGSRDKTVRIVDVETGQVIAKMVGHVDHVKGVCFTPKDEVVSVSLDGTCRVIPMDENVEDRNVRFVELPSGALCVDAAPTESRFAQLIAVGCSDSRICFIDLSFTNQQPLFREAQMIAERAKATGDYTMMSAVVKRYPLVVHSEDRRGNTLCHYAVMQENDTLLNILLSAKLPEFWLPVNADGADILHLAVSNKSRSCVKLILDCIISAKESGQLSRVPSRRDRFLRTLLQLADEMDDLLALFLKQFGLDDAPGVLKGDQLSLRSPRTVIMPSAIRLPEAHWNNLYEEDRLGEKDVGKVVRFQAKYLSIPNFAGLIRTSASADPVSCLKDTVLHRFVRTGNAQLFGNPLLKMVLDYKWQAYARSLFMRELGIFGGFLVTFTLFSLSAPRIDLSTSPVLSIFSDTTTVFSVLLALVIPFFCYRQLKNEYRQVVRSTAVRLVSGTAADDRSVGYEDDDDDDDDEAALRSAMLTSPHANPTELVKAVVLDGWNLLQSGTATLALISAVLFLFGSRWFIPVTSAASFFLWLEILYFLRAFEFTGGLVRMVFKIFYYTGPFLLILVVVLLGTANCFHVLFSTIPSEDALFQIDDSVMDSVFKTFKLLLLGDGTVEEGLPPDDAVTGVVKLLFVVFMVGINIFMLNLMINLMDDFMQKINDEEGDAFPFEKARIIAEIELSMGDELLSNKTFFPRWLHMLTPKGGELGEREGIDEWQGTVQAIRAENMGLERRTRDTLDRLQAHIITHFDAMEKRQTDRIGSLDDRVNNKIEALADSMNRMQAYQVALMDALSGQTEAIARARSHRSSSGSMRSPSAAIRSRRIRPQGKSPSASTASYSMPRSDAPDSANASVRRRFFKQAHSLDQSASLIEPDYHLADAHAHTTLVVPSTAPGSLHGRSPRATTPSAVIKAASASDVSSSGKAAVSRTASGRKGTMTPSTVTNGGSSDDLNLGSAPASSASSSGTGGPRSGSSVRRRVLPPRQNTTRAQHFRRDSTFSSGSDSRRESRTRSSLWDDDDELVVYGDKSSSSSSVTKESPTKLAPVNEVPNAGRSTTPPPSQRSTKRRLGRTRSNTGAGRLSRNLSRNSGRKHGDGDGDGDGDGGAARPTPAVSRSSSVGFAKLGLNALLAAPLAEWNIITPTDVQAKGWKPISFGNNTLLAAHTGTGKTLAYALPIVQRYIDNDLTFPRYSTLCLVPTRELAVQVHSVFVALLSAVVGDKASQHVHCVVKGIENSTPKKQLRKLKRENPPIIIATPARFLELLEKHPIADEVETVVLDEADKLLDPLSRYASPKQKQNRERHPRPTTTIMDLIVYRRKFGPGEDRRPYRQMAQRPQVICASASLTTRVKRELVQRGWCAPQSITTVSLTDGQTLPDNLQHFVVNDAVCAKFDMPYIGAGSTASQADCLFAQLEWTLSALAPATALVFVPTSVPVKDTTNRIAQFRARTRTAVDAIAVYEHVHAATSPADAAQRREDLLARFASATPERPVVGVANMDAIRGLDIPNVELACIVGTPRTHVDYLHIAGRVGRGNRQGTVVVFAYDEQQQKRVDQMARKLRISIPQLSPTNGGPGIAGGAGDDGAGADTNHAAGSNLSSPPTDTPTQRR